MGNFPLKVKEKVRTDRNKVVLHHDVQNLSIRPKETDSKNTTWVDIFEERGRAKPKRELVDHRTASDKGLQLNSKENCR